MEDILSLGLDSKLSDKVFNVLSSHSARKILKLVSGERLSISEIAQRINIPQSTVTVCVQKLERAGLVKVVNNGSRRFCSGTLKNLEISISDGKKSDSGIEYEIQMPVGLFSEVSAAPPCGLLSSKSVIGTLDDVRSFYHPERAKAGLVYFGKGQIKYKFQSPMHINEKPLEIQLILEMCSEAPFSNENYPSDITLWLNEVEVGTWTCPGDFGKKRGKFTPVWWNTSFSQYGLLKIWTVNQEGSFIDGKKLSERTIDELKLHKNDYIEVKLGNKEEAMNSGGMNIFGKNFGNYGKDIIMKLTCAKKINNLMGSNDEK